jgi:hypothetical protein
VATTTGPARSFAGLPAPDVGRNGHDDAALAPAPRNADRRFANKVPGQIIIDRRVTDREFRLFTLLLSYARKECGHAWPSNTTLGELLDSPRRVIQRQIRRLVALGLVKRGGRCPEARRGARVLYLPCVTGRANPPHGDALPPVQASFYDPGVTPPEHPPVPQGCTAEYTQNKTIEQDQGTPTFGSSLREDPQVPPPRGGGVSLTALLDEFPLTEKRAEQIAILVKIGSGFDAPLSRRRATAIVREHGHGKRALDVAFPWLTEDDADE